LAWICATATNEAIRAINASEEVAALWARHFGLSHGFIAQNLPVALKMACL
jgi:hypothetical protein